MAVVSANITYNRGGHDLLDKSSIQKNYSAAMEWARNPYSNAAVGQFIFLQESETVSPNTPESKEYLAGPYIVNVIGDKAEISPLSKSTAGTPDLAEQVSGNSTTIKTLETTTVKNTDFATNEEINTEVFGEAPTV